MKHRMVMLICLLPWLGISQTKDIDSSAVYLLDHMTRVIGDLSSCTFTLNTSMDEDLGDGVLAKVFTKHAVHMAGPDKMMAESHGEDFHKGYWYNGQFFAYYAYNENNYSIIPAPADLLTAMDSLNTHFDIEFPAGDFFYPAFTDDLVQAFDSVEFLGTKTIDGREYFHILADGSIVRLQIWLSNDATTLPFKFIIKYKQRPGSPEYEATFSEWRLNPDLPETLFDFVPPPGANEIYFVPKNAVR